MKAAVTAMTLRCILFYSLGIVILLFMWIYIFSTSFNPFTNTHICVLQTFWVKDSIQLRYDVLAIICNVITVPLAFLLKKLREAQQLLIMQLCVKSIYIIK